MSVNPLTPWKTADVATYTDNNVVTATNIVDGKSLTPFELYTFTFNKGMDLSSANAKAMLVGVPDLTTSVYSRSPRPNSDSKVQVYDIIVKVSNYDSAGTAVTSTEYYMYNQQMYTQAYTGTGAYT